MQQVIMQAYKLTTFILIIIALLFSRSFTTLSMEYTYLHSQAFEHSLFLYSFDVIYGQTNQEVHDEQGHHHQEYNVDDVRDGLVIYLQTQKVRKGVGDSVWVSRWLQLSVWVSERGQEGMMSSTANQEFRMIMLLRRWCMLQAHTSTNQRDEWLREGRREGVMLLSKSIRRFMMSSYLPPGIIQKCHICW